MSQQRIAKGAGWGRTDLEGNSVPKGQCRYCNGPIRGRRISYCSDACVHEWKLRTDPGYVRQQCFKRDQGVCGLCGHDTKVLRPGVKFDRNRTYRDQWDADHIVPVVQGGGQCGLENYRTLCLPCHKGVTAELAAKRARERAEEKQRLVGLQQISIVELELS